MKMPDEEQYYTIKELAKKFDMKESTFRRKVKKYLPHNEKYMRKKKISGVKQLVTVITDDGSNLLSLKISEEELGFDPGNPPLYVDLEHFIDLDSIKIAQKKEEIATLKRIYNQMDSDQSKQITHIELQKKTEELVALLEDEIEHQASLIGELFDNK
ncbi:hypothetical protein [Sporolactobacillus vineae]|uniref:hypothetical protein n=1 Tax=Sporolactobacillus vineae TaxID=444463 RepID=UPI0002897BAF|nr:hypothetical protein [Sporolactobacillus vineae]